MFIFSDVLGILGVVIQLGAYARVQWQRDFAKSMLFSFCNALGTFLICISLLYKWNPASFLGNTTWFLLSVYGMFRCNKYRTSPADQAARKP